MVIICGVSKTVYHVIPYTAEILFTDIYFRTFCDSYAYGFVRYRRYNCRSNCQSYAGNNSDDQKNSNYNVSYFAETVHFRYCAIIHDLPLSMQYIKNLTFIVKCSITRLSSFVNIKFNVFR